MAKKNTFMDIVDEVIEEELEVIDEFLKEEVEPIVKERQEMEKRAFERSYQDLLKLEQEVK